MNTHDQNWHSAEKLPDQAVPSCFNWILALSISVSDMNQWKWGGASQTRQN